MILSGVECQSEDEKLGKFNTVLECARACREKNECNYFVFGTGTKAGECYWEKTKNQECPEGWEFDQYHFYEKTSMFGKFD